MKLISLYAVKYGAQNEQTLRSLSAAACQSKSINRNEFDQKIRAVRDYAMTQSYQVNRGQVFLESKCSRSRTKKKSLELRKSCSVEFKVYISTFTRFIISSGVENIYTQHIPAFKSLIENVARSRTDTRLKTFGPNAQTPQVLGNFN